MNSGGILISCMKSGGVHVYSLLNSNTKNVNVNVVKLLFNSFMLYLGQHHLSGPACEFHHEAPTHK